MSGPKGTSQCEVLHRMMCRDVEKPLKTNFMAVKPTVVPHLGRFGLLTFNYIYMEHFLCLSL